MEEALTHLRHQDPVMAALIDEYKQPRFEKHTNYYHELVSSIISQQLSVKAAAIIEGRFKDLFGGSFPSPEQILEKDIETLRGVGLSRPKAAYIQDLASKVIDKTVIFSELDALTNEDIRGELTKVKGIGVWTTHMFLMFCMGRLDVLPTGDLGIRNGVARLYGFTAPASAEQVDEICIKNNWQPYASVASWFVWQSLDNAPKTT